MANRLLVGVVLVCIGNCIVQAKTPVGHLKPFGNHRPPSVPVDEFTTENAPNPKEFFEKYVRHSKPVIFRGAVIDSKAYQSWTDEYVRENFGENEVRLEGKKEKKHIPPLGEHHIGRDNLRHFVDNYHNSGNNAYVVSDLPSAMYKDMGVVPSFGACGDMSRSIVEVDIWWSGGGSSSIIHKDAFNQMNCLLNGTKYWKLIEYKYEKDIYKHPEPEYEIGGFSDINPEKVDLIKQPKVSKVEWSNVTIHAGDCLFLPKSYYHQVNSDGTNNKAVSLLFARFDGRDSLNFSDCTENVDYKSLKSLADFDVQWVWPGKGVMVMGRTDLEEGFRPLIWQLVESAEKQNLKLDYETFKEVSEAELPELEMEPGKIREGFNIMDLDGNGILTSTEVNNMSLEDLRKAADQFERYEPSNTYEFEYSIISFEGVWALAKACLRKYKTLTEDTWLKHYAKTGGTMRCGKEIFERLADGKKNVNSADVTDEKLYHALENWVKYWAPQYSGLTKKPTKLSQSRRWEIVGRNNFEPEPVIDQYEEIVEEEWEEYYEPNEKDEL